MEIKENEVYTHEETQVLLKVSASTVTRMLSLMTIVSPSLRLRTSIASSMR